MDTHCRVLATTLGLLSVLCFTTLSRAEGAFENNGSSSYITTEVYEPVVLTFAGGNHPNPYTDVVAYALFRGPAGKRLKVYAYWDGNNKWRIRFNPTSAGTWSYTIRATGDPLLDGISGRVKAIDTGRQGFVVRDSSYPFSFKRSNGGHVFLMGDTLWNGMSSCGGALSFDIYQDYIDKRALQKFNFIRSYICALYSAPKSIDHQNEGGCAFEPWDPDHLNPAYFRHVEKRIEYANSKGFVVHLLFGSDKRNITKFFGWGNGKLENYIRYCCARLGAFDIAWEGRAEFEEQGSEWFGYGIYPGRITLANQVGNWVEEYDPYSHIQSMHTLDSNNELGNEKWLDWIMHQGKDWDAIAKDRIFNKPVLSEEFYYENSGGGASHSHHSDATTLRKGAWKVMTAGASGLAYGNTGTYNSRSQPFKGLKFTDSRGARYMTHLYNFWSATSHWKLSPSSRKKSNHIVWCPGEEYVAYFEKGGRRSIYLHPGNYKHRWYNPRTGLWNSSWVQIWSTGENIAFSTPDKEDWVLYVVASAGSGE